jgi:hydrogenase maturation factor
MDPFGGADAAQTAQTGQDSFGGFLDYWWAFYYSNTITVIRFFLMIWVAVIIVNLFLLVVVYVPFSDSLRVTFFGNSSLPFFRKKYINQWNKIAARLDEGPTQWKIAVLEADQMTDWVLGRVGYAGGNIDEKIKDVPKGQIDFYDELVEAHRVRNQIVHDSNFTLEKSEAKEALGRYEKVLRSFELFT